MEKLNQLATQTAQNPAAQSQLKAIRLRVKAAEQTRQTEVVQQAIAKAKAARTFEAALNTLQKAIAQNPLAMNLGDARKYQQLLETAQEQARKRLLALQKKQEKINRMTQQEIKGEVEDILNHWLKDMQMDNDTSTYWASNAKESTLFNVKSWELLGVRGRWNNRVNIIRVLVDSTNKGGIPIRCIWNVFIERNQDLDWKITLMNND